MRAFLVRAAVTAVAIVIAESVVPDFRFGGSIEQLVVLAVVLGAVNGLVKPVVDILALPARLATLGLATFLVNGGLLLFSAWLARHIGIHFTIGGFPPHLTIHAVTVAVLGALVIGVVSTAASILVPD